MTRHLKLTKGWSQTAGVSVLDPMLISKLSSKGRYDPPPHPPPSLVLEDFDMDDQLSWPLVSKVDLNTLQSWPVQ